MADSKSWSDVAGVAADGYPPETDCQPLVADGQALITVSESACMVPMICTRWPNVPGFGPSG